jgi:hypothetical protein
MPTISYVVVAQYAIGCYAKHQIISCHFSYGAARKAAKRAGDHFTEIRPVSDFKQNPAARTIAVFN